MCNNFNIEVIYFHRSFFMLANILFYAKMMSFFLRYVTFYCMCVCVCYQNNLYDTYINIKPVKAIHNNFFSQIYINFSSSVVYSRVIEVIVELSNLVGHDDKNYIGPLWLPYFCCLRDNIDHSIQFITPNI